MIDFSVYGPNCLEIKGQNRRFFLFHDNNLCLHVWISMKPVPQSSIPKQKFVHSTRMAQLHYPFLIFPIPVNRETGIKTQRSYHWEHVPIFKVEWTSFQLHKKSN